MSISNCKSNIKDWQYFKLNVSFENEEIAKDHPLDLMTWKQLINNALKRTHGIFGEGIEYFFLNQEDKIAYLKVSHLDKDMFSSAISTYISSDSLVGFPMTITILQEESILTKLQITDDDKLWFNKAVEEVKEDSECS
ncbi:hypothetical protein ZYGR_0AI05580 [Zygosaccharomyces rouxii]|uniref:Ribonucleases P/MRP subunit Pop8-like domain-containing protein n=1 Tax=Zygosaccharomyces rouxii TaxID=4956 RepID=A0A1Q3ABW4_ZYGRO|nr:hypothetical protein ZYGR_0AI05580 [Zygosaccharomyces rouxii]